MRTIALALLLGLGVMVGCGGDGAKTRQREDGQREDGPREGGFGRTGQLGYSSEHRPEEVISSTRSDKLKRKDAFFGTAFPFPSNDRAQVTQVPPGTNC